MLPEYFVLVMVIVLKGAVDQVAALVGGKLAERGELPWVVYVALVGDPAGGRGAMVTTCTGTLVSATAVLTAAHCLERGPNRPPQYADHIKVVGGVVDAASHEEGRQERAAVSSLLVGRGSKRRLGAHDLALVRVSPPFTITAFVRPLSVANTPFPAKGMKCIAAGFGSRGLDTLDEAHAAQNRGTAEDQPDSYARISKDSVAVSENFTRGTGAVVEHAPERHSNASRIPRTATRDGIDAYETPALHPVHSSSVKTALLTSFSITAQQCETFSDEAEARGLLCLKVREGQGLCLGDSGSGLVCDGELHGVAHAILPSPQPPGVGANPQLSKEAGWRRVSCGGADTSSVYVDTFPSARWLDANLVLLSRLPPRDVESAASKGPRGLAWLLVSLLSGGLLIHVLADLELARGLT